MPEPRPLSQSSDNNWRQLRGVFADIDDTLTTDGHVTSEVFAAMEDLRSSGLIMVPITGRPAGWCDLIARQWPVDAVVGENGAFYFRYDEREKEMRRVYADSEETRQINRARLDAIRDEVLREIPGAAVSADQAFRANDLAIDFCEDVVPLDDAAVQKIVEIFIRNGATAKISSIHVNGWFGDYDKLTMTKRLMAQEYDTDLDSDERAFAFVGDSPNDAPMFGYFSNAVGVANLQRFLSQCDATPAWITNAASGAGFVEFAKKVLAGR